MSVVRLLAVTLTLLLIAKPAVAVSSPLPLPSLSNVSVLPTVVPEAMVYPAAETLMEPMVRLALASVLQHLPVSERRELATGLLVHGEDAEDHRVE